MSLDALDELISQLDARRGVEFRFGRGGGGAVMTRWLAEAAGLGLPDDPERTSTEAQCWSIGDMRILDTLDGRVVFLPEGCDESEVSIEAAPALLRTCAADRGWSDHDASWLADRFETASLVLDVQVEASPERRQLARALDNGIRGHDRFRQHLRQMTESGGTRLLDLARVLHLFEPHGVQLGDEWVELASAHCKRTYTIADLSIVQNDFPDLFTVFTDHNGVTRVRPSNRYVSLLFSGLVPASTSEYYELFAWLQQRAIDVLVRNDSADEFISEALPLTARRAEALPELARDGIGMLASDITVLSDCLEEEPTLMVLPGAKAALVHAHRLQRGHESRDAQMEFALHRMSLGEEAVRLSELLRTRGWAPVWATTNPVNVHRIVAEDRAGALCLSIVAGTVPFRAYVGFGNGAIKMVSRHYQDRYVTDGRDVGGEVRGLAVLELDGSDLVCAARSDAVVSVYRVIDPSARMPRTEPIWSDEHAHGSPLSAAAIWRQPNAPVLLTAGVAGTIVMHDLQRGEHLGVLADWPAEIRSVKPIRVAGQDVALLVAVDGSVGVVDLLTGEHLATTNLALASTGTEQLVTPTCGDAHVAGERVDIVVGCATGHVFTGTWTFGQSLRLEQLIVDGVPRSGANSVTIRGQRTYVSRNDGLWLRHDPTAERSVRLFSGHVGPVACHDVLDVSDGGESVVLSGGAEGAVRIWRHTETSNESLGFLRFNRHRGPVRAIRIRRGSRGLDVFTGGNDGDVRLWADADPSRSRVIAQHDGRVTDFLSLPGGDGGRLISASDDGSIRATRLVAGAEEELLLGIAHEGVAALTLGPHGEYFWSAGEDGALTRWDVIDGTPRGSVVVCEFGSVLSLTTAGESIMAGGQDGTVTLVMAATLESRGSLTLESGVKSLTTIPGTYLLAAGLASGVVCTFDRRRDLAQQPLQLTQHEADVVAVAGFQVAGQPLLASVGRDRRLLIMDISTRTIKHTISLEGFPTSLAVHGRHVAVATSAGAILIRFNDEMRGPSGSVSVG